MKRLRLLGAALLCAVPATASAQLYADFQTSLGNFSVDLFFQDVPRTVANFVALAEGSQPWLDARTYRYRTAVPFYDGLTFHRVIPGFVIQAGSPLGDGSDGPGYVIPDEFRKDESGDLLYKHLGAGVLSMANAAARHSGHSQFFITLSSQPSLDHVHTVFGKVSAGPGGGPTFEQGMAVIDAIANVPRDTNDRPQPSVFINHVGIRREGPAAQTFEPIAWQLPKVRGPMAISLGYQPPSPPAAARFLLGFDVRLFRALHILYSPNLTNWQRIFDSAIFDAEIPNATFDVTPESTGPAGFFQIIETDYSSLIARTLPQLSGGASVRLKFTAPFSLDLTINRSAGAGTWSAAGPPPSNGGLAFASYGGGAGDAGLFSPQMTLVFSGNSSPSAGGKFLLSLTPSLTFNADSMREGYFSAVGNAVGNEQVGGIGIFEVLTP
ncbi:MAG: peptidylprolyl isomerase [Verrucomicrobiales bacterium]